jgi:hypothetical protein
LFLIFYFFFHHQPFEMLNDSKSYRQRHHWVAENKRKKRQERQRAASFYRIAVSRTTRGISRTPFKCPENAHTQKRRQSTRSIVSFLFARALLLLLGYSQVCGTPIDWRKEFICVCVSAFVTSSGWASENIPAHPLSFSHHQMKGKAMQKVMGQHNTVVCWRPISSTKEGEPFSFDSL